MHVYVTSVLQRFRPTILRTYDSCRSNVHSILFIRPSRNCIMQIYPLYVVGSATIRIDVPVAHVGRMHNFRRSDTQIFVDLIHNCKSRTDAQVL